MYICFYLKLQAEIQMSFYMLYVGRTSKWWILFMSNSDILNTSKSEYLLIYSMILLYIHDFFFFTLWWRLPAGAPHPLFWRHTELHCTGLGWWLTLLQGDEWKTDDFSCGENILSETEPGFFLAHPTLSLGGGLFCFLSIPGTHLKNSESSDVIVALYTIFELGLLDDTTALYIRFAFVTL